MDSTSNRAPAPLLAYGLVVTAMLAFVVLHTRLLMWKSTGLMAEWPIDLTFFHNLIWNLAEGNGHIQSASYHEPPGFFGETHFEPIILLAVPFYWLAPGLPTLARRRAQEGVGRQSTSQPVNQ